MIGNDCFWCSALSKSIQSSTTCTGIAK